MLISELTRTSIPSHEREKEELKWFWQQIQYLIFKKSYDSAAGCKNSNTVSPIKD